MPGKSRFSLFIEKRQKIIFALLVVVISSVVVYFIISSRPPDFYLSIKLGDAPPGYSKLLVVTSNIDLPMTAEQRSALKFFVGNLSLYNVTPTIFVSARDSSRPVLEDIAWLSSLDADFGILSPYDDFSSLPYDEQESSLWALKDLFSPLNASGFRTRGLKADYNTVLAAENARLSFFSGAAQQASPQRPSSPLGGKLRIILFPVSNDVSPSRDVWTLLLPPSPSSINPLRSLLLNSSVAKMSMSEASAWLDARDMMSVQVSTDLRRLQSSVQVSSPVLNSSIVFFSNLPVVNVSSGNESIPFAAGDGFLVVPVRSRFFTIKWAKP